MQKRAAIIIIVVLVVAGGAYAIFHKSPAPAGTTTGTSANTTTSNNNPSNAIIQTKTAYNVGKYLADSSGTALYTYGQDANGVSNCIGVCLNAWPIYVATSSSALPANVTIIHRNDGGEQYAYKGKPLYTFTGDTPGQVNGNGVSGFSVAVP